MRKKSSIGTWLLLVLCLAALPVVMMSATERAFPGTLHRSINWLNGITGDRLSGWIAALPVPGERDRAGSRTGGFRTDQAASASAAAASANGPNASTSSGQAAPGRVLVSAQLSPGGVTVGGKVPEAALDAFMDVARRAGDSRPSFDTFPGNAPFTWLDRWVEVIGVAQFSMRQGSLEASNTTLRIEGESLTPDTAELPLRLQQLLGPGVRIDARLRPRGSDAFATSTDAANLSATDAGERDTAISRQITSLSQEVNAIRFPERLATLDDAGRSVLDKVFEFLFLFPDERLLVQVSNAEFADREAALELSRSRADELRRYLVERGIDGERVVTEAVAAGSGDSGAGDISLTRLEE